MHLPQSLQIHSKRRRAESFQARYQGALLNVQIITLLYLHVLYKNTFTLLSVKCIIYILVDLEVILQ